MESKNRRWIVLALVVSAAVLTARTGPTGGRADQSSAPHASAAQIRAAKQRVLESYDRSPLSFEVNQGQTDPRVSFLSRGRGYALFLTPTQAVLTLQKDTGPSAGTSHFPAKAVMLSRQKSNCDVLVMKLVGANATPRVVGLGEQPSKSNYFTGKDQTKWHTNIANYARVKYEKVYPGVDLVFHGSQSQLEYDFVVQPGANPQAVRLAFEGADKLRLDNGGNLVLHLSAGEFRQHAPLIYQDIRGAKHPISGGYALLAANQVSFRLAPYDPNYPLVIDPTLSYSTYLGGAGEDDGSGIAVDTAGNVYVTGGTASLNFPLVSPMQPILRGDSDAFVAKFDPNGSTLVFSTYFGGGDDDEGTAIAVDASGVYVTGNTFSFDFPATPGAYQTTPGGGICGLPPNTFPCPDVFAVKLNPSGANLLYATYLGGNNNDEGFGIAADASGNAYVTGSTQSANFPTTPGAFQPTFGGGTCDSTPCPDAFVAKLDPAGATLVYSSFLGGNSRDEALGIAVDPSGSAYVAGFTKSTNFPTTPGAFQPSASATCGTPPAPCTHAFVTKFDSTGSMLAYSTYLAGTTDEEAAGIAIDAAGNAFVVGATESADFPITPGAFQTTFGNGTCGVAPNTFPCPDVFVTKLNPTGSALVYSTFVGGNNYDDGAGIAVDASGNAFVTGFTVSTNFPTANPFQAVFGGGPSDAFVAKLNAAGSALLYSTYLGGSSQDKGAAIAVDASGAYVTGLTASPNFPPANPLQPNFAGGVSDAFVTKLVE